MIQTRRGLSLICPKVSTLGGRLRFNGDLKGGYSIERLIPNSLRNATRCSHTPLQTTNTKTYEQEQRRNCYG